MASAPHVGTMREKPLHAALKAWYAEPGDRVEHPVDGYVIDLVRGTQLIEIQTRGFSSMKRKLTALLEGGHDVRIVHPIAVEKTIVKVDEHGAVSRRRSPKRGAPCDLFAELVSFPALMSEPGLEIELVLVREEELRTHQPGKAWRRRGWVVEERRLLEVVGRLHLATATDLLDLVPGPLPDPFTTADVATALHRPRRLAQQATYCLRHAGVVRSVGKQGNTIQYSMVDPLVGGR